MTPEIAKTGASAPPKPAAPLKPAWSIAFRWPDGARDCEAVAVDAARGQILLISKKRQPPELFALPLRPRGSGLQVARKLGTLAGVPRVQRGGPARRSRNARASATRSPPRTCRPTAARWRY